MFQQGLGQQAVTPSCAGVRCVRVGCGHHVQHWRAALVSVFRSKGSSPRIGKLGTRVGICRAERDCSVL